MSTDSTRPWLGAGEGNQPAALQGPSAPTAVGGRGAAARYRAPKHPVPGEYLFCVLRDYTQRMHHPSGKNQISLGQSKWESAA